MDGEKAGSGKAVQAVQLRSSAADDGASPPSARATGQAPLPGDAAAAAASAARGGSEEVDDEQVERFYALLANIRAMRGAYGAAGTGTDGGGARKRARCADPPWRPAFRLEDFEEPSPSTSGVARRAKRTPMQDADDDGDSGARPAVASESSSPSRLREGVRLDSSSQSI